MNYIVKIIDGRPVIFGTAGKENDGAPVYVFQEKEAFDAALEAGMIPVGALIVKTYDAVEMAGGPFDAALSGESENAVQNKIISAEVSRLDRAIADAVALRASLTEFGLGKICPVDLTDVTEDSGLVLGAFEKNASVEGTLANQIHRIQKELSGTVIRSFYVELNFSGGGALFVENLKEAGFSSQIFGALVTAHGSYWKFLASIVEANLENFGIDIRNISDPSFSGVQGLTVTIFGI